MIIKKKAPLTKSHPIELNTQSTYKSYFRLLLGLIKYNKCSLQLKYVNFIKKKKKDNIYNRMVVVVVVSWRMWRWRWWWDHWYGARSFCMNATKERSSHHSDFSGSTPSGTNVKLSAIVTKKTQVCVLILLDIGRFSLALFHMLILF